MASQVDINTCTDAYTHSTQGVGTEMRQLGQAHSFHETMHRECYTHQQAGRQKFMYWYMYTFETSCGNRNGVTGTQTHWYTGVPRFPSNYAYRVEQIWAVRMDLNTCTDAWRHSKQGVKTQAGWLGHRTWDNTQGSQTHFPCTLSTQVGPSNYT